MPGAFLLAGAITHLAPLVVWTWPAISLVVLQLIATLSPLRTLHHRGLAPGIAYSALLRVVRSAWSSCVRLVGGGTEMRCRWWRRWHGCVVTRFC